MDLQFFAESQMDFSGEMPDAFYETNICGKVAGS